MSGRYTKDLVLGLMLWLLILLSVYPEETIWRRIVLFMVLVLYIAYMFILGKERKEERKRHRDRILWVMLPGPDGVKRWTAIDKDGKILEDFTQKVNTDVE